MKVIRKHRGNGALHQVLLYQKHKEEYNKAFEQAKIKIHKEYVSSQKKGPVSSVKNSVKDAFLTERTYINGRGSRGR